MVVWLECLRRLHVLFQFESNYKPHHLGNWQVGKWHKLWPRARRGATKVIADDRGHLLPGVPRAGTPWGAYRHTWKLPKRITRKLASELNGTANRDRLLTSWEKRSSHIPLTTKGKQTQTFNADKEKDQNSEKKSAVEEVNEYQPYDKDEHDYSHTVGCDRLTKVLDTAQRVREDIESYTEACRSPSGKKSPLKTLSLCSEKGSVREETRKASPAEKSDEEKSVKSKDPSRQSTPSSGKEEDPCMKTPPPLKVEFLSAQHAKDLAQDNLKHHPLPDIVPDALFKAMQMNRASIPTVEPHFQPQSSAVGYKDFESPGPSQCTKMRVHRPKTAARKPKVKSPETYSRPKTGFAHTKDLTEIDLALCWDLLPVKPEDEPKKPAHIDGSNGSMAPSVFTLVKPQADDLTVPDSKKGTPEGKKQAAKSKEPANPSAVMDIINNNDLVCAPRREEPQTSVLKENDNPNVRGDSKRSSVSEKNSKNSSLESSLDSEKLMRRKHYRSSPNLPEAVADNGKNKKVFTSRPCMACETKDMTSPSSRPKSDYKMAFKAGVPNNGGPERPQTAKLEVPKPKTPFARRSYSIGTLIPPFSLWPGTTGMEYPEHWRLASVYQHSYKPIEARKKTLLASVYK
ncbi:hypothetical protein AAG570_002821 [Ranatra chinensis]|uniref:Cilia- and flagella-associated protein 126 n=1 Tax=Ranatra chinensis TaxID=642074 RepID=A0ABD0Y530_9HEMI